MAALMIPGLVPGSGARTLRSGLVPGLASIAIDSGLLAAFLGRPH
jgi:hypothetical protein